MSCLPPALLAGILLSAIPLLKELGLPAPSATEVLEATPAAKSSAYRYKAAIEEILPDLARPSGRPSSPPEPSPEPALLRAVHGRVLAWLADHPGGIAGTAARRIYADGYRHLVLELWAEHRELGLAELSEATGVAETTLRAWARGEHCHVRAPENPATVVRPTPTIPQVETILAAWKGWSGSFTAFCDHVQRHLRIPFARAIIGDVLEAHGVRLPKQRGRWRPDTSATRGGFETFGAGLQWEGDGAELVVQINGLHYLCNLELLVDSHTDAFVGASVRPTEDSAAVADAFADGVTTTGAPPIAVLLDNKPSNHTEAVQQALGSTLRIRARPFQPTDKPHVEGAFGLFRLDLPELCITATTPEQLALQIATLVATAWARAANHRPRADRGGRSRAQLYLAEPPTEEQIAEAEKALRARLRKQERARRTRAMRQDPIVHALLDDAFARLGLDDPERHHRTAIASWPLDDIVEGIAIFEGKRNADTLPEDADASYLAGIVRNLSRQREGMEIAEALLRARLDAHDRMLAHLQDQRDKLEEQGPDPEDLVKDTVDRALAAERRIDRLFWLQVAADTIRVEGPGSYKLLLRIAARRIHATYKVP
jgi:hypothetical protein